MHARIEDPSVEDPSHNWTISQHIALSRGSSLLLFPTRRAVVRRVHIYQRVYSKARAYLSNLQQQTPRF
jgi:hypothetical protein